MCFINPHTDCKFLCSWDQLEARCKIEGLKTAGMFEASRSDVVEELVCICAKGHVSSWAVTRGFPRRQEKTRLLSPLLNM